MAEQGGGRRPLYHLLEIEAANLIKQGGSPWLWRIVPYVSEAAIVNGGHRSL